MSKRTVTPHYNADPSDPDNLAADNEGIACEDLPSGGATQVTTATTAPIVITQATTNDGPGDDLNCDNFASQAPAVARVATTGTFSKRLFLVGLGILLLGAYILWINSDDTKL